MHPTGAKGSIHGDFHTDRRTGNPMAPVEKLYEHFIISQKNILGSAISHQVIFLHLFSIVQDLSANTGADCL